MNTDNQAFVDYYHILGVASTATEADIRSEYLAKAKNAHPDAGGSTELMQELNNAYQTLMNETSRQAYDKVYRLHSGEAEALGLQEEPVPTTVSSSMDGLEDAFVDQLYSEYYGTDADKKKNWIKKIFK